MSRRLTILGFAVGWVALTAARCAWSWDGSYYFLLLTNGGPPFAIHDRYTTTVLMLPTWLVGQWSAPMAGYLFSATYATVPPACLWLCCRLLRATPERVVWPAVGLLITLPGQLFLVSEAGTLSNLTWPLAALAVGPFTTRRALLGAFLALAALFLHPLSAVVFFAFAAALGVRFLRERDRWLVHAAGACLALASVGVMLPRTPYERAKATSWSTLREQFAQAVNGAPLRMVVLAGVAVVALHLGRRRAAAGCLVLVAVDGIIWAADPTSWPRAFDYRAWTVPFTLVAVAGFALNRPAPRPPAWILPGVAAIFGAVLAVQAAQWQELTNQVRDRVEEPGCLEHVETGTALYHWGTTPLSAVVQGPGEVRSAIVDEAGCKELREGRLKAEGAFAVESDRYVFGG